MKYDKNEVCQVIFEGVDQGLFIGRENKYYDVLYKYWCFLRFTDEVEKNKRHEQDTSKVLDMTEKLLSSANDLIKYIKDNKDRE